MKKALGLICLLLIFPTTLRAMREYKTGATHHISFFNYTPTFKLGFSRAGRSSFEGPTTYVPKWTFSTAKAIFSSPVIDRRGRILFGSRDHTFYCLHKSGKLLWKFQTGDEIDSTATVAKDGTIYFGSDDKHLYALNSKGKLKWKYRTSGVIRSSALLLPGNVVVVPNYDGYLYALQNGRQLWMRYLSGGWANGAPAFDPNLKRIYIANNRGNLHALDTKGVVLWSQYISGYSYNGKVQNGTVTVDRNGNLFFGSQVGVFSYTPQGKRRWQLRQIRTYSAPSMTKSGDFLIMDTRGTLYKFSESGKIIFKKKVAQGPTYSSILIDAKGRLYFGSRDDHLYALDAQGNQLFSYKAGKDVETTPALSPAGVLYFGTDWGRLHAIQ